MTDSQITKCKEIAIHYGIQSQSVVAVEELSELQKAICKAYRSDFVDITSLQEEIADVQIMIEQIKYLYNLSNVSIKEVVDQKLKRQMNRIEGKE